MSMVVLSWAKAKSVPEVCSNKMVEMIFLHLGWDSTSQNLHMKNHGDFLFTASEKKGRINTIQLSQILAICCFGRDEMLHPHLPVPVIFGSKGRWLP